MLSLNYVWAVLEIFIGVLGTVFVLSWNCVWTVWNYVWDVLELCIDCHGTVYLLSWNCARAVVDLRMGLGTVYGQCTGVSRGV